MNSEFLTNAELEQVWPGLVNIGRAMGLNHYQAEDQAQQALIRVWKYLEKRGLRTSHFRSIAAILRQTTRHCVTDYIRKEYRIRTKVRKSRVIFDSSLVANNSPSTDDRGDWLLSLKMQFDMQKAGLVQLVTDYNFTVKEVADHLGVEEQLVRETLETVLKMIRQ